MVVSRDFYNFKVQIFSKTNINSPRTNTQFSHVYVNFLQRCLPWNIVTRLNNPLARLDEQLIMNYIKGERKDDELQQHETFITSCPLWDITNTLVDINYRLRMKFFCKGKKCKRVVVGILLVSTIGYGLYKGVLMLPNESQEQRCKFMRSFARAWSKATHARSNVAITMSRGLLATIQKKDNSDVATYVNHGVVSFSSWFKSICNPKTGITRIIQSPMTIASFRK